MIVAARAAPLLYARPDVFMFGVIPKPYPFLRLSDT